VIAAIKPEFDEYGVAEDVLGELQEKWENKVIASHVADFDAPGPQPQVHHAYPPHPIHMIPQHPLYPPHVYQQPQGPQVKAEPVDGRYALSAPHGYALPPLPGPSGARPPHPGGQQSILSFPPGPPRSGANQQQQRIPQVDGPSSASEDDSPSPPPSQSFAPRPSHPSLPQPPQASGSTLPDDEAINSDLDDSDTGDEEGDEEAGVGETDIVFCTYDKVARVKNKWKCILKDGMIHVNGRDYLFAKCTGEFEW